MAGQWTPRERCRSTGPWVHDRRLYWGNVEGEVMTRDAKNHVPNAVLVLAKPESQRDQDGWVDGWLMADGWRLTGRWRGRAQTARKTRERERGWHSTTPWRGIGARQKHGQQSSGKFSEPFKTG